MPDDAPSSKSTLAYQPTTRRGLVTIEMDADGSGVSIDIRRAQDRPWPLVIGFGSVAAVATAIAVAEAMEGRGTLVNNLAIGGFGAFCAVLAFAASLRGDFPRLEVRADEHGLRMCGGERGETLAWPLDEIDDVAAESEEGPKVTGDHTAVVVTFVDGEFVAIPLPGREDQEAVVAVLRAALKVEPPDQPPPSSPPF